MKLYSPTDLYYKNNNYITMIILKTFSGYERLEVCTKL